MAWYICFYAALAVVVLTAVLLVVKATARWKFTRRLQVLHILMGTCFLTVLFLAVPPFLEQYSGFDMTFVLAFQMAMEVFGVKSLSELVHENMAADPQWFRWAYISLALTAQFFAPLLTAGFVLSFFKNLSAYTQCFVARKAEMYIFSELNPYCLTLARDIQKDKPKARIVFADAFSGQDAQQGQWVSQVRQMGAILFNKSIQEIRLGRHSKAANLHFLVMSDNEEKNMEQALQLVERYRQREHTRLYFFASGIQSELLLAAMDKGKMQVRRVNKSRNLIYHWLWKSGTTLYQDARGEVGSKQIGAVVVGMGSYGTEMTKALTWYCQMEGYRFKLDAFDKDKLAEERFTALCPELMDATYNHKHIPGEAQYDIEIHGDVDVSTKKFADEISKLTDTTLVFISLGSNERNIQTAVQIRMLFERIGIHPRIQAVVRSSHIKETLRDVRNFKNQPYDIEFVDEQEQLYTAAAILRSDLEQTAYASHESYCNDQKYPSEEAKQAALDDFWRHEYNYRSSMATAIHIAARVYCGIPGAAKKEADRTPEEAEANNAQEHSRWNAYMRTEGYIHGPRNDLAKRHHNLVVYGDLSDEDKKKDGSVSIKL